jgi:hypothetical protein
MKEKPVLDRSESIEELIARLEVPLKDNPAFIIVGICDLTGNGGKAKIFFTCNNEFHTRMIYDKLMKIDENAILYLERTEYNKEKITFSLCQFIEDATILREKYRKTAQ